MTKKPELRYLKMLMARVPNNGIVVEVGSWVGESARKLAKGIRLFCPNTKLYCIDIWDNAYFEKIPGLRKTARSIDILQTFERTMAKYPHTTMKMSSVEAAKKFISQSVDLVFIDAEHTYEAVKVDIATWLPKIKVGGIMCGHDFDLKYQDVARAVIEKFPKYTNPVASIWETIIE